MDDLVYIGILLVCCAATAALVVICDKLAPSDSAGHGVKKS